MDLGAIDIKRSIVGTLGIVVAVVFIGLLGPAGLLAGLCAIFLGVLDDPAPLRQRLIARARFVTIGALAVGLLAWSGDSLGWATLVAGLVTYVGTLAAGWGKRAAAEGQFLVLLAVVTLMVGSTDLSAVELALSFAAGGVVATAVSILGSRWSGDDAGSVADAADASTGRGPSTVATDLDLDAIGQVVRSTVGRFALFRAGAVAIATAAGYELFESHPVWAMLTVVLVLQPPARQTWTVGLQRTAGTIAGVAAGIAAVVLLDSSTAALAVAFVVAGFGMMAFTGVNYVVSTAFTTCVLLLSQRILQEDAFSTAWERIGATVLGTVIALAVVFVAVTLDDRSAPADSD